MKEKIYTIPINESFEEESECPFCYLENKLEREAVDYALGAAMMEPDFRIISNEKGYCRRHFTMMINSPNKLSLALVLDTHLKEVVQKLEEEKKSIKKGSSKGGIFAKKNSGEQTIKKCEDLYKSCVVCDRINETMKRYIEVFFYMIKNDEEFKNRVFSSKGFCMKHFTAIVDGAFKHMRSPEEFVEKLFELQIENLKRINEENYKFTLKFDYRNRDMEWGTAADAPQRAVEKLGGYITEEEKR